MTTREQAIVDSYARTFENQYHQEFFNHSGFSNLGYWSDGCANGEQASKNLVNRLLSMASSKRGRVLDVACGQGGTTRLLSEAFGPENVVAINLAQGQLDAAAAVAPGCTFLRMDATRLEFPDASFDLVVCVEAAFHFDTREMFLAEANRVLRPGGVLVLSDILFSRLRPSDKLLPKSNKLPDQASYRAVLERCGFGEIAIEDVFDKTVDASSRKWIRFFWEKLRCERGPRQLGFFLASLLMAGRFRLFCREYLLVAAIKPGGGAGGGVGRTA